MILFEDKDIIVCHKRSGLAVQSARIGQKDMVSMLNNHLAKDQETVRVVHRLDQPVEGVIVFAKNKKAAAHLSRQITEGSMKKIYHAVCCVTDRVDPVISDTIHHSPDSEPFRKTFHLEDYLVKDGRSNTSRIASRNEKEARYAELYFRILGTLYSAQLPSSPAKKDAQYLLAEIDLQTGRHHQIRVQMAHAGLPLYGDQKYNPAWEDYLIRDSDSKRSSAALCAVSLTFRHPSTGQTMTFEVTPSDTVFQKLTARH
jgi:23S rRNA pseudouridine1911/1915/1917 synthase